MIKKKFFHFLRNFIFSLGALGSLLYLLTCTTPYLSPSYCYLSTFFALSFPIGLIIMICWCLISLFFYRKYFWIFFVCLLFGYKNIFSVFAFNLGNKFEKAKSPNSIRILSWNVNNFLTSAPEDTITIKKMLNFIQNSGADIICFQDYSSIEFHKTQATTENLKKITSLPYSYFTEADKNYGVIIFSRWPIIKQVSIPYNNISSSESLQYVDIKTPIKVIRVYNTHLCSMNIHVEVMNNSNINHLKFITYDTAILMHKSKLNRLAYFDKLHEKQAYLIKKSLDSADIPFIYAADMNSVPSSFVYHHISAGLNDAFLQKGFGFGRTYDSLSPTLRIDVLLTSPSLETKQYYSPRLHLSDHLPIITDIQIKL